MTIYLNGKFVAQATTGVQRVAHCLLAALDELPALPGGPWVLVHPAGASVPPLRRVQARAAGPVGLPLHLWEQAVLPWLARDGLLVNLAGSAPALARHQICHVHDAAVFDSPVTYTRRFAVWYRALFHWLTRRSVVFLTVSEFSRQRLSHHLGVPAALIEVVGNGADHLGRVVVDPSIFDRLSLGGAPFMLAVGDTPGKNFGRVRQAFCRLPAALGCRLVVVGERNAAVFADAADATSEPAGVLRAGRVSDAELKALYGRAAALVFPSLYEGFGLPVVEAMAMGCPVIAARAAALPEVCGSAAILVDPMAVESIAEAMHGILTDVHLASRLRTAGLQRVAPLRWEHSAYCLARVIDDTLRQVESA